MNSQIGSNERFDAIVESYLERLRQGERPAIEEYAQEHPEFADDIRRLFRTLTMVEEIDLDDADAKAEAEQSMAALSKIERVGDYRLVRVVGQGGMGIVYEAEQQSLGRRVALKVLPPRAVHKQTQIERLHREARAVANLQHPHVVSVHDVGEDGGVHYIAMQFIAGQGLDDVLVEIRRLRVADAGSNSDAGLTDSSRDCAKSLHDSRLAADEEGPLPDSATATSQSTATSIGRTEVSMHRRTAPYFIRIARIGVQAADALEHAHQQGILHRDIKPSNLMLDAQGDIWVTDFGLATMRDADDLTQTGDIVGTLRYMAPERFRGEVDERSDVYSLGLTLYELLTTKPAFDTKNRATLIQEITRSSPAPPRRLDPDVPRNLETIVLKAIAGEPSQRYASASELSADLRLFLTGKPIRARRTSLRERLQLWQRRNPLLASLSAVLCVLLLILLAGSTVAAVMLAHANRQTLDSLDREVRAKDKATKNEELALHALYEARIAQAQSGRLSGRPGQRVDSLKAIQRAADLIPRLELGRSEKLRLRNEAIGCMSLFDVREDRYRPLKGAVNRVDYDASRFAYWDSISSTIKICHMQSGKLLAQLKVVDGFHVDKRIRFSFDGEFLAASCKRSTQSSVQVWRCDHPYPILNTAKDHPFVDRSYSGFIRFTPVAKQLALIRSDRVVEIVDLDARTPLMTYPPIAGTGRIWLDPTTTRTAVYRSGKLQIIDLKTSVVQQTIKLPISARRIYYLEWLADGRIVAAAASDKKVYVWESDTGALIQTLIGHAKEVTGVSFHPQANLLKSYSYDGTTRFWTLPSGDQLLRVHRKITNFSNDGRWAGSGAGRFRVVAPREHRMLFQPRAAGARNRQGNQFAVHPNGRLLVVGNYAQTVFWDVATWKLLAAKDVPGGSPRFNADGTKLFTLSETGRVRVCDVRYSETDTDSRFQIGPGRVLVPIKDSPTQTTPPDVNRHTPSAERAFVSMHVDRRRSVVRLLNTETQQLRHRRVNHNSLWDCSVTSDGRLFATSTFHGRNVRIWDGATGKHTRTIQSENARIRFSPDGLRLAVSESARCSFFDVKTGKLLHQTRPSPIGDLPAPVCFSADGTLAAFRGRERHTIKLLRMSTFQELATMTIPDDQIVSSIQFSPDGGHLLVSPNRPMLIHVWDLRILRKSLGKLDWNGLAIPNPNYDAAKPLRIVFNAK